MIISQNPHLFGNLCKLAFYASILRIRFIPEFRIVKIDKKPNDLFWCTVRCWIFTLTVLTYAIQCVLRKKETQAEGVISWVFLMALVVSIVYVREIRNNSVETVSLINYLFQLDSILPNRSPKKEMSSLEIKINVAFVHCEIISALMLPIGIVYAFHIRNPCQTTLDFHWIIPDCNTSPGIPDLAIFQHYTFFLVVKILVFLINHWIWSYALHACVFGICTFQTLSVRAIHQLVIRLD